MRKIFHNKGISFFNVIILIVLVGLVTSFTVSNLFKFIEFTRSIEALTTCKNISDALNFCKMSRLTYRGCERSNPQIDELIKNPESDFTYVINVVSDDEFTIIATRNLLNEGDGKSAIIYKQTKNAISKSGTGVYIYIQ